MFLGTILGAKKYVLPTSPTLMARVMEKVTNVKAVLMLYWPTLSFSVIAVQVLSWLIPFSLRRMGFYL